jgi:N-acetylmuramoyl-L-alanine amidase
MNELTTRRRSFDKSRGGRSGHAVQKQLKWTLGAAAALIAVGAVAWGIGSRTRPGPDGPVLVGEAREGGLTIALPQAVADVRIREARVPGRAIVLIDAGHGGRDPGAAAASGGVSEKQLTLAMANELADVLEKRGRVRVALTRTDDRYLTLDQRAAIARRIGASLFVSLHMDSAPNPLARGATFYSLSDVASSEEAARFASAENRAGDALSSEADGSLRSILSDLALRGQMEQSAQLALRTVRRAQGRVLLRPRPHQFAAFHVLRRADIPAVLVEAGYISNVDDEAQLVTPEGRAGLVLVLAQAIEADLAQRRLR